MPAILRSAAEKRALIRKWEATAIPLREAHARDLIRYSSRIICRNWTTREALYEFAIDSAQAHPVLVRVDEKRLALFTPRVRRR